MCLFVLCNRHWFNRVPGAHLATACVPSTLVLMLAVTVRPFKLVLVASACVCVSVVTVCNVLEFTARAFAPQTRIVVGAKCSKTSDDSPQNLVGIPGPHARLSPP